jgi:hypothetical protein
MLTPEQVADLKEKHGSKLACVESPSGPLVFRKPTRSEFDRWFDANHSDKANATKHARQLIKACRVFPDEAALDAALDATPSLTACECLTACTGLCGMQESFQSRQL